MDFFSNLLGTLLALSFPILVILIYLKRRRQKENIAKDIPDGVVKETATELAHAEDELRKLPIDIREAVIETHDLYDRYSTHRGYSNVYMEALTSKIRDAGISCELVFQATLPMGLADAVVEPQGVFELYILRNQMTQAKKLIPGLIEAPAEF